MKIMANTHYHVLSGLQGGYMPNGNTALETEDEALQVALDQAEAWNDDNWDNEEDSMKGGAGWFESEHELIHVTDCTEPDCYDANGQLVND